MVPLHSIMSLYNVESMLGSRFIFNNGNTHNGLISRYDPNYLDQFFMGNKNLPYYDILLEKIYYAVPNTRRAGEES